MEKKHTDMGLSRGPRKRRVRRRDIAKNVFPRKTASIPILQQILLSLESNIHFDHVQYLVLKKQGAVKPMT